MVTKDREIDHENNIWIDHVNGKPYNEELVQRVKLPVKKKKCFVSDKQIRAIGISNGK